MAPLSHMWIRRLMDPREARIERGAPERNRTVYGILILVSNTNECDTEETRRLHRPSPEPQL